MVQYRKSKKIGPFRITASQRGISASAGYGPARITRRADGRIQRTIRVPGAGIYDTRVVSSHPSRVPGQMRPSIPTQLFKLALCLIGLWFLLSVIFRSFLAGTLLVGGAVLIGLIYGTVVIVKAARRTSPPS